MGTHPRPELRVYDGDGGPADEIVRDFVVVTGDGIMEPKSEQPQTDPWIINFDRAVATTVAQVVANLKQAHLDELGRLETRLLTQRDDEIRAIRADHQQQMVRVEQQHVINLATQSAGFERAMLRGDMSNSS